jgi:hypothetical protein
MNLRQCCTAVLISIVFLSVLVGPVLGHDYPVDPSTFSLPVFQNFLNTTSAGDTITFGEGTYDIHDLLIATDNLTFQSNQSYGGTTQNTILDGINGPAATSVGILYNISGGYPIEVTHITISHLTLRNGFSQGADGGGAIDSYANVTVISSDFFNDSAPGKYGGAINIHSNGQNLTVTGSNFTWCHSGYGGALSGGGNAYVIVNSSSFTNCYATSGGAGFAGAIYGGQGGTINFCRFGNVTSDTGGKIVSNGGGAPLNVNENWWGTNSPTSSLTGGLTIPTYLKLGITATPTGISTSQTSTIQANLSYDNTSTLVAANILPDGIPVIFSIGSGPAGAALSAAQVLTTGHQAATTFSSPATGTALVNASVDGFNVSVNVPVIAAPTPTSPGHQSTGTCYSCSSGANDPGYTGPQPTPLGLGPSPTKTIPATPATPVTPAVTPAILSPHPLPAPSVLDQILAAIQQYFAWLVLIVIIIVLAVLLRRWWIRRQNPALFRK